MSVILKVERKTAKARMLLAFIYGLLTLGGITMVWPFLVMLASSITGPYDYYRFTPFVRAVWDRNDRFLRYVATCFPQFPATVYPEAPAYWSSWPVVARDGEASRAFAERALAPLADSVSAAAYRRAAQDYAEFNAGYDIRNSICAFDARDVAPFIQQRYEGILSNENPAAFAKLSRTGRREAALARLNRDWSIRYLTFFGIRMIAQQRAPLQHAAWDYDPADEKMNAYQDFKRAYRELQFTAGIRTGLARAEAWGESPMTRTRPFESRPLWVTYLRRADVQEKLGFDRRHLFTPADYAKLAGEPCEAWAEVAFPFVAGGSGAPQSQLAAVWDAFIHQAYPRRLLRIRVTPRLQAAYSAYLKRVCKTAAAYRALTGRAIVDFGAVQLPAYENSTLWRNFIPEVPLASLTVLSAEQAWQSFLLKKYGTLAAVNRAYGWKLARMEQARLPIREALAVTFAHRGWKDFWADATSNYRLVADYLFLRGRAFGNTLLLVVLSILATLTVNPLAAYALSRLGLRISEKVLLFMLATMAFPAAVTAIPGFLLIRDLGLLNTFAALVLPTLANGMSIFILKGFFDALPRELYEAAEIDGAREWQVFWRITLPMTTPILAVNALTAFVTAYNSWEWALLVCQKQSNWTLAVWMYQMSQQLGNQPWAVMAGFVLVSIPTAVVFIACQKIILRGIVLPSMK